MKHVGKMDSTGFFLFQVIQLTFRPMVSSHSKAQRCSRNGLREFSDPIAICTQSGSVQQSNIHILSNFKFLFIN